MKPLRKWVRKRQHTNPEWDMPAGNPPAGHQSAVPSMHTPYYPQQVQQLLDQNSSSGATLQQTDRLLSQPAPRPQQQQQQAAHLSQTLRNAGIVTPNKAPGASNGLSLVPAASGGLSGPLATLFAAAAKPAGAGAQTRASSQLKQFSFDKQAIMHALI